jgi:hypothetical protein
VYEEAKAYGLDSTQFPPLPELLQRFLDIEPRIWRRGEVLRQRLRAHCVLPGMRLPNDVRLDDIEGISETSTGGAERTFDYDLFVNWLGFRDQGEAMAYFEARRQCRRQERQLRRLAGVGLLLFAALGQVGMLVRSAWRVPGGFVIAMALSATLDAALVTSFMMVAMPILLLLWDFLSAPAARRFDPRRIHSYRASDAVRRLLFMYAFMVWPLLGSAAGLGAACTLVLEPTAVTGTVIQGMISETGIFWLILGIIARVTALLALWQWPDLNQEVRVMASGRGNRLVHAFCLWRWLVTSSCMWAILLRCIAFMRPVSGLVALQYPSFWGLGLLARHRPLWLSVWLEQGLAGITAAAAGCILVAYICYALYYVNFVIPKLPDPNQLYPKDPSDTLPTDQLSRIMAECMPPGARQRFSPIQAILLRLGLIDDDRPESWCSDTDERPLDLPWNKSALCRFASNPIILDDDDDLLHSLDPTHPDSYLNRLLRAEERAHQRIHGPNESPFQPRWEWVQVPKEERRALTSRIRAPPPPPDQRPLVELVESDLFKGESDSDRRPETLSDSPEQATRSPFTQTEPRDNREKDNDYNDDDRMQGPDVYHA